jgi:hypothetical protein
VSRKTLEVAMVKQGEEVIVASLYRNAVKNYQT